MASELRGVLRRLGCGLLLAAELLAFACQSQREDPTGGETHFLARCDSSAACGRDLVCVCHVCTLPCSDRATCGRFASATCALPSASDACELASPGYCDVVCVADADCGDLSAAHVCVEGACRVPAPPASSCPISEASANEVVLLGDSFFAAGHRIAAFLEDLARQRGALSAGERYRDYSSLLGNELAGKGIESQYVAAAAESDVKIVIMSGGGADVLLGSCEVIGEDCPLLVDAATAARELLERMANDSVEHVIYAFYPDPSDATLRAEVDALRPLLQSACADSPVTCHWVDLRTAFAGNEATFLDAGGTSPTEQGAQASAAAIWTVMQQQCIAQ